MQLPSLLFIFYCLPFIIAVYFAIGFSLRLQNLFLLFCSLFLYAWGQPVLVIVLTALIIFNWLAGRKIARDQDKDCGRRGFLFAAIGLNTAVLICSAYLPLIGDSLLYIFGRGYQAGSTSAQLPLGVSFFTLMAISYLIDVYRREAEALSYPLGLGLYLSFFPIQAAGPLIQYNDIASQLNSRKTTLAMFSDGLARLVIGLAKIAVLAKTMGDISSRVFGLSGYAVAEAVPSLLAIVGLLAFAFYIYFHLSGLADMAIGLALVFGFTLKENFKYPYAATTMTDFWRRWNISAVDWFRNYIFAPLRKKRMAEVGAESPVAYLYGTDLLLVGALFGLWHGPALGFCMWGLYHGLFLLFENIFMSRLANIPDLIKRLYVIIILLIGWVTFAAESPGRAMTYYKNILCLNDNAFYSDLAILYLKENYVFFIISLAACLPLVPALKRFFQVRAGLFLNGGLRLITPFILMAIYLLSIIYLLESGPKIISI